MAFLTMGRKFEFLFKNSALTFTAWSRVSIRRGCVIDEDPAEPLAEGTALALADACGCALFRSSRGLLCATTSGALAALAAAAIAAAACAALMALAPELADEPVSALACRFCRDAG